MRINYMHVLNSIKEIVLANNKLNPSSTESYVKQVIRQRYIPGPPLPVLLIHIGRKDVEPHGAIGYEPFPQFSPVIRIVTSFPNENTTSAMLTQLGIAKIMTPEQSDNEIYTILDELESTFRADSTTAGQKIRHLNDPEHVKRATPGFVNFGIDNVENGFSNWCELFLDVQMRISP